MRTILSFLSRYGRWTRIATAIVLFVVTVVLTLIALRHGSAINDEAWALWAAFIQLGFAVLVTPIIVSLVNENYQARGTYGMFSSDPESKQPPGLFDPGFNDWYIGK